jgi:hypothetical protein
MNRMHGGIMELYAAIEGYWLAKRRELSVNTVNDYSLHFRRLQKYLGPNREFKLISTDEIHSFLSWMATVSTASEDEIIALDGKQLQRSHDKRTGTAAIHMGSAWRRQDEHGFCQQVRKTLRPTENHSAEVTPQRERYHDDGSGPLAWLRLD